MLYNVSNLTYMYYMCAGSWNCSWLNSEIRLIVLLVCLMFIENDVCDILFYYTFYSILLILTIKLLCHVKMTTSLVNHKTIDRDTIKSKMISWS